MTDPRLLDAAAHDPAAPATADHAATPEATEQMLEQARLEAQERIAEVHVEEGTVRSEGGAQNSPHPDDHD